MAYRARFEHVSDRFEAGLKALKGTNAWVTLLVIIAVSMVTGCASPGIPRPPSLHLPAAVTDLTASRVADRVDLHWTPPTRTTDGLDLTTPTTIEICRDPFTSSRSPQSASSVCTPSLSAAVGMGATSAVDHLPPGLLTTSPQRPILAYRIRVINQVGRSGPSSAPAFVPGGPSPLPVEGFTAIRRKDGVVLEWRKTASSSSTSRPVDVEVVRTMLDPKPSIQNPKPGSSSPGTRLDKSPETEIRMRQEQLQAVVSSGGLDGMVDRSALAATTYTYSACSVVSLDIGGKSYQMRGEPTSPVTLTMRDTFPPEVPRGLVSVPGGSSSSGQPGLRPTIDLAWAPNAEVDLVGYIVYRADLGTASVSGVDKFLRLTPSPVASSTYRDQSVLVGHRYRYRITSIDLSGNESAPSTTVDDSADGR